MENLYSILSNLILGLGFAFVILLPLVWLDKKIKNHSPKYTSNLTEAKNLIITSGWLNHSLSFKEQIPSNNRSFNGICLLYTGVKNNEIIELLVVFKDFDEIKKWDDKNIFLITEQSLMNTNIELKSYLSEGKVVYSQVVFG